MSVFFFSSGHVGGFAPPAFSSFGSFTVDEACAPRFLLSCQKKARRARWRKKRRLRSGFREAFRGFTLSWYGIGSAHSGPPCKWKLAWGEDERRNE